MEHHKKMNFDGVVDIDCRRAHTYVIIIVCVFADLTG